MDNISPPYEETTLVTHVSLSANTLKEAVLHLRDKLGDLWNQRRPTVATEIIRHLNVWVWTKVGTTTNIILPLSSLCRPPSKELASNSDSNQGENAEEGSTYRLIAIYEK